LEIFLKIRGASCKYVDCGLILEKMRGVSAKCLEMGFSRNYFVKEKPVDQVHGSVDRASPVHHGPAAIAARGSSPKHGLRPLRCLRAPTKGRGSTGRRAQRWGHRGSGGGGGASHRWRSLGLEGSVKGMVRAKRRSVGGVGVFTEGVATFYRAETRRGRSGGFNGRR
jgi:hypothetical protein